MDDWRNKGFCVFHNFFPEKLTEKVLQEIQNIDFGKYNDFGSRNGFLEFPCLNQIFNQVTLNTKLITYCQKLLNCQDIRLIQSDIWSKSDTSFIKNSNHDQRMHMDYPNNYLTHPSDWNSPESVAIIIYWSDSSVTGGETRIVPRIGDDDELYQPPYIYMPGLGKYDFNNDKTIVEEYFQKNYPDVYEFRQKLYQREIGVDFKPGTVLFYRHDVWHRGFPINIGETRVAQNIGYKKAGCDWITCWNYGWARHLCDHHDKMEIVIKNSNNLQKKCLGFPDDDHIYYNNIQKRSFNWRYHSKL